jgi:hypothetical protein
MQPDEARDLYAAWTIPNLGEISGRNRGGSVCGWVEEKGLEEWSGASWQFLLMEHAIIPFSVSLRLSVLW